MTSFNSGKRSGGLRSSSAKNYLSFTFRRRPRGPAASDVVRVDPSDPLIVQVGAATGLAVDSAIAYAGVICLFEDRLRRRLDSGALEPVLESWWRRFPGPFLYSSKRRLLSAPIRAFVDFTKAKT